MNILLKGLKHPRVALHYLLEKSAKWFPGDELYLKLDYYLAMNQWPDLKSPQTYNEKMQWLKLHDKREEYTEMVDKYETKKYVSKLIGEEYIIPTLGVWDNFDAIDFSKLPDQFVLKTTHDSGGVVICKDKNQFNIKSAKKKLEKSLRNNFYYMHREYPYKNVRPRIIAEKFMVDESGTDLNDYKFFCFNGKVKMFKIDFDRFIEHHANYYAPNGQLLPFGELNYPPVYNRELEMPTQLEKMKKLAEELSNGIPFVRVDFYEINGNVYFGELTFFPAAGYSEFTDLSWDYKIGEWLKLPEA